MSQLTQLKALVRRPVRRSKIVHLTHKEFGVESEESRIIISAADETRDLNRGKKRKDGEARISHERDMYVILLQYINRNRYVQQYLPLVAKSIFYHDRWEENPRDWPLYRIEAEAGRDVRDVTRGVSKPPRLTESELVSAEGSRIVAERVRQGGVPSMIVKIIDRTHFFLKPFPSQNSPRKRRKLVWKVAQTMVHIQEMAFELGVLTIELEILVADCIRKNNITNEELMEFV